MSEPEPHPIDLSPDPGAELMWNLLLDEPYWPADYRSEDDACVRLSNGMWIDAGWYVDHFGIVAVLDDEDKGWEENTIERREAQTPIEAARITSELVAKHCTRPGSRWVYVLFLSPSGEVVSVADAAGNGVG